MMISGITFIILLVIFLILNGFDIDSTIRVVRLSSMRSEKNPVARFIFRKFGLIKGVIILKSIIIFLIPLMIWVFFTDAYGINLTLLIADIFYMIVVINNYWNYKKVKKIKGVFNWR